MVSSMLNNEPRLDDLFLLFQRRSVFNEMVLEEIAGTCIVSKMVMFELSNEFVFMFRYEYLFVDVFEIMVWFVSGHVR